MQLSIRYVLAYSLYVVAVVASAGWTAAGWTPSNWPTVLWTSLGLLTLAAVPVRPIWGVFVYIAVVYCFPRYSVVLDYIFPRLIPEVICYLTAFGFSIWFFRHGHLRNRPDRLLCWLMLGFVAVSLVSGAYAVTQSSDWFALKDHFDLKHHPGRYLNALILFLVAVSVTRTRQDFWWLAAIAGLVLNIRWMIYAAEIRVRPGDLAEMLVMVIPLCVAAAIGARNWILKIGFAVISANMVVVLYVTQNRGAVVAFGAVLFVLWIQSARKWRNLLFAAPVLIAVGIAAQSTPLWERFASIPAAIQQEREFDASSYERLELWKAALKVWREHWLLGVGPGRSPEFIGRYTPETLNRGYAVHNNFLAVMTELGIIGLLLYIGLFGGGLRSLWHAGRGKGLDWPGLEARFLSAALIGYLVAGCFITRHDQALPYILLGVGIALVSIGDANRKNLSPPAS